MILYLRRLRNIQQENLKLEENLNYARQFFYEVEGQVNRIRRYRHDLKKHILIVEEFLKEENNYADYEEYQELTRLMSGMQDDMDKIQRKRYCDHEVLNAICEIKQKECDEAGIPFQVKISCPDLSWIDNFHLTGIIMNLLDNALEAEQRLEEGAGRRICLELEGIGPGSAEGDKELPADAKTGPGVKICVGNTVSFDETIDFQTRKKDRIRHGVGLSIAREYSAIYHGELKYHFDKEGHFLTICTVLLKKT